MGYAGPDDFKLWACPQHPTHPPGPQLTDSTGQRRMRLKPAAIHLRPTLRLISR